MGKKKTLPTREREEKEEEEKKNHPSSYHPEAITATILVYSFPVIFP